MNAAAQRRLTPACAAAVAVLGIVFLSLLFGVGRSVTWDPPRVTPPLPAMHSVALPSPPLLQTYSQVWEHPLFSSDRKPIVSNGSSEGVSIGDLQLTGVIITPTLRMALLGTAHDHDNSNNKSDTSQDVRVREGATLPDSSWKLIKVLPRSAIFASSSGRTELKLPAGAPIDQMNSASANQAIPMGGPQGAGPMRPPMTPMPAPPPQSNDAQSQRLLKLRAAILKQRSQQSSGNAQGDH